MTALDRPDSGQDERVWVQLPAEDVAFLRGFDPDRDRTASRADMVRVVEHLQDALAADVPPLARVLAEVAAEVQRQDEAGDPQLWSLAQRSGSLRDAAREIRSVLAFDQRTEGDR